MAVKSDKAMTLDEIARLACTSKSTVSRVLSDDPRISDRTRDRVNRIIRQRNYRPNPFARALAGGRTGLVGVISSNIGSGFYADAIRGMDLVLHHQSLRLLVSFAHEADDYDALWREMAGGHVDGVIVLAPTAEFFRRRRPLAPIPSVICSGVPPSGKAAWRDVDSVNMDNAAGMHALMTSLKGRGCRRILHAAGWINNHDAGERQQAFADACRSLGVDGTVETFGITPSDGKAAMLARLARRRPMPDAIVCFNDSLALGVLDAWHEHAGSGSRLPFILSGWDDMPAAAAIGFTSVRVPAMEMGETAARVLLERIEGMASPGRQFRVPLEVALRLPPSLPAP